MELQEAKAPPCRKIVLLSHRGLQESAGTGGSVGSGSLLRGTWSSSFPLFLTRLDSRAPTAVHHHVGDLAVDDLLVVIKVEHVDGGHLGGGAAGAYGPSGVGFVHQVGVGVRLQVHVLALPGAVVGLVALRGNNPVPAEVLEVHRERVAAAPGLGRVLFTVQTRVSPGSLGALGDLYLHERLLKGQKTCERLEITFFFCISSCFYVLMIYLNLSFFRVEGFTKKNTSRIIFQTRLSFWWIFSEPHRLKYIHTPPLELVVQPVSPGPQRFSAETGPSSSWQSSVDQSLQMFGRVEASS